MADRREAHRWEESGRRPTRRAGFRPSKGSFVMKLIALLVSCTRPLQTKKCVVVDSPFRGKGHKRVELEFVIEGLLLQFSQIFAGISSSAGMRRVLRPAWTPAVSDASRRLN